MCHFIFCQSLTIVFFYSFLVFDAFLIAFFFPLEDRKTDAFLTSLSLPTFLHEQYTKLMLVLHASITPFTRISGWLHAVCACFSLFVFIALLILAHCFLDAASLFYESFFISLEYNLKYYFRNFVGVKPFKLFILKKTLICSYNGLII